MPSGAPMPTVRGRGAGAIRKGGRGEQRRLRGAAMRAERRERTDSAGLLAAGHSRSSAARGTRRVVRGTAGTSRPLHPNPGSPLAPEGPPLPEGDGPHPTRCLGGEAPSVPAAPAPPGASSAPTPPGPRPGAPPPETGPPSPAAAAPTVRLTSAALRTDGRAGRPGQQPPRRARVRGTEHGRSSARAAAAASRRAPPLSPITQRPGPATRATEGGRAGGRGATTSRRRRRRRLRSSSDSRGRLRGPPPSECPASVLAKLRPQPPARDTAPSPAAARHLGPPCARDWHGQRPIGVQNSRRPANRRES